MMKINKSLYSAVHKWLRKNYGSADFCENKNCEKNSFKFEWCKIAGKTHEFCRDNYIQMCKICHKNYDYAETNELKKETFLLKRKKWERLNKNKGNIKFKDLVKEIRMKCLITQSELAKWSKIDQVSISHYEAGNRKPGLIAIKKMINVANEKAGMNIKYEDIQVA